MDTVCRLGNLQRAMDNRDRWWERERVRELCHQHDLMMMMMIAKGVGYRKHCLQFDLFQENELWWTLPCFKRLSAWPSLRLLHWELFLYWKVSVFPPHRLSFPLKLVVANPCLVHLLSYFSKNMLLHAHHTIFCKFYMVSTSKNLMTDLCSSSENSV